jgi:hypothetical protein
MRFFVFACLLSGLPAYATTPIMDHDEFFCGSARTTPLFAPASAIQTAPILIRKSVLPSQGKFIEIATTMGPDAKLSDFEMVMKVEGTQVSVSDDQGSIEGTGTLSGPDWAWNVLTFTLVSKTNGAKITDVNYITPDSLIARKTIFTPSGTPVMLMEVDALRTSESAYLERYKQLHGH